MSQFDYKQRASKDYAAKFDRIFNTHAVGPHKVVWTKGAGSKAAVCQCIHCGEEWDEGGVYAPRCVPRVPCGDRA